MKNNFKAAFATNEKVRSTVSSFTAQARAMAAIAAPANNKAPAFTPAG